MSGVGVHLMSGIGEGEIQPKTCSLAGLSLVRVEFASCVCLWPEERVLAPTVSVAGSK